MNIFQVTGRLVKDPVLNELDNGSKVANITLAVERRYKTKENKNIVDFVDYSLWGKLAENICKISKQGSVILLTGNLETKKIKVGETEVSVLNPVVDSYQHIASKHATMETETEVENKTEKSKKKNTKKSEEMEK